MTVILGMERIRSRYVLVLFLCVFLICLRSYLYTGNVRPIDINLLQNDDESSHKKNLETEIESRSSHGSDMLFENHSLDTRRENIWISMGLCFGKNTHKYGKKNYPYTKVAPLAILLWNYFVPSANIIIYIIYDPDSNKEHRDIYELELRKVVDNRVVYVRWIESKDMSCPLKSQLFRLWAFQEDVVKDNDIIVTVDANLFVMTSDILNPIFHNPNMKIWIFQYDRAENKEEGYGNTFNQNLIAAKPKGKTLFFKYLGLSFYKRMMIFR